MKRIGLLLLGLCLTVGVVSTIGCGEPAGDSGSSGSTDTGASEGGSDAGGEDAGGEGASE